MPISEQQVLNAHWQLQTKAQSYDFGRRLYQIHSEFGLVWLKLQVVGQNQQTQMAFEHELKCYRALANSSLVLPHRIMTLSHTSDAECTTGQGLLLMHANTFLDKPSHYYSFLQITELLLQMLQMLNAWHQLGWVHGDIKHEHVVQYAGRCYLFDFEQSQKFGGVACGALCSTPRYMAPELFQGAAKTHQSDLYALGIVFWEWLTTQRLGQRSYRDWALWHCQQAVPRVPQTYSRLQALLNGLLAKRSIHRFANAEHALKLLQHQVLVEKRFNVQ